MWINDAWGEPISRVWEKMLKNENIFKFPKIKFLNYLHFFLKK